MTKVLTFSRHFPKGHPEEGEPTYFVEKIYAGLADSMPDFKIPNDANEYWDWHKYYNCQLLKHHTIRSGDRWRAGDKFSPRIWSGKPYQSKQVVIAPDLEVRRVYGVKILFDASEHSVKIINKEGDFSNLKLEQIKAIANNDGLSLDDFVGWFNSPLGFLGQIICWGNVDYDYMFNFNNI